WPGLCLPPAAPPSRYNNAFRRPVSLPESPMVRTPSAPAILAGLIVLAAAGCQDEAVRHYKVPRVPEPPTRLLGAILPAGEQVWFVKLSGPETAVAPHRDEFEQFVQSIRFPKQAEQPITWTAPTGWRTESGARDQRYAT